MSGSTENREMLQRLFASAGMELSSKDLEIVGDLYDGFSGQRHRLTGSARPETEPMIIPAFERVVQERQAGDERES